jgi:Protein of unknown function (DUF2752)
MIITWLEKHLLSCPFKKYFHIDCPGCGLQRSFLALLKGNFIESFKLYPATVPFIFLLVITIIHLKADLKFGATLIKILFVSITAIILIGYIYKIYNHKLY